MAGHALIAVRAQPRAKRTEVVGERDGAIVIRVQSPPVDGQANVALCRFVAARAGVPRSAVSVERGATGRDKLLRVEGTSEDAVRQALLGEDPSVRPDDATPFRRRGDG